MPPPLQPQPVNSRWWFARHENFLSQARNGNIRVLFLGDSITDLWQGEGRPVWHSNFAPLAAANFGIGGDKVENVLWRVRNGELDRIAPRVVVLLIGTNNLGSNSVEDILATQLELIVEIHRHLPKTKVLLLGVFPRVDSWSKDFRGNIEPINQGLARLADGHFIHFLNIGDLFKSPAGGISPKIMHDGLHLTEKGYEIWAGAMLPTLKRLLGRQGD